MSEDVPQYQRHMSNRDSPKENSQYKQRMRSSSAESNASQRVILPVKPAVRTLAS